MKLNAVIDVMKRAKWRCQNACIELAMPDQEDSELIIVSPFAIDQKIEYYLSTYTEDGVHKNNPQIRMIGAGVVRQVDFSFYTKCGETSAIAQQQNDIPEV